MTYRLECDIETRKCLTTIKYFSNAKDCVNFVLNNKDKFTWCDISFNLTKVDFIHIVSWQISYNRNVEIPKEFNRLINM